MFSLFANFNSILPWTENSWFIFSFNHLEYGNEMYGTISMNFVSIHFVNRISSNTNTGQTAEFLWDVSVFVVSKFEWVWHRIICIVITIGNQKFWRKVRISIWTIRNSSANCTLSRIGHFPNNKWAEIFRIQFCYYLVLLLWPKFRQISCPKLIKSWTSDGLYKPICHVVSSTHPIFHNFLTLKLGQRKWNKNEKDYIKSKTYRNWTNSSL